jgi:hypothetical protein
MPVILSSFFGQFLRMSVFMPLVFARTRWALISFVNSFDASAACLDGFYLDYFPPEGTKYPGFLGEFSAD